MCTKPPISNCDSGSRLKSTDVYRDETVNEPKRKPGFACFCKSVNELLNETAINAFRKSIKPPIQYWSWFAPTDATEFSRDWLCRHRHQTGRAERGSTSTGSEADRIEHVRTDELQEALPHWIPMTAPYSIEIATRHLRLQLRNSAPPQRAGR